MKININVDIKVNRIVKYFILSDIALLAGWGFIQPIFSVFIIEKVAGATLVTIGIAAAVYWILKSVIQLPIAKYLDRTDGEKDDFFTLILGLLIVAFASVLFAFVNRTWELYAVQVIHATGFALYAASWPAIFSRHLDKDKIAFDWTLDSTAIGIATGVTGFLGGVIASWVGYVVVFIAAAFLSVVAAVVLMMAPELVLPKKTTPSKAVVPRADSSAKLPRS